MGSLSQAVAVKIEPQTKIRLKNIAFLKQDTSHGIMRKAILSYLDREEKIEEFRLEAIKAWEEHDETGLHITDQELSDWLLSIGTEFEKELTPCHE